MAMKKNMWLLTDKPIDAGFVNKMRSGVKILGTITNKCFVKQEGEKQFRIILTQGLNRQIRRMCAALGYKVISLKRVRIMNVTLKGLLPGKWRHFSEHEIAAINAMVSGSSKTD